MFGCLTDVASYDNCLEGDELRIGDAIFKFANKRTSIFRVALIIFQKNAVFS